MNNPISFADCMSHPRTMNQRYPHMFLTEGVISNTRRYQLQEDVKTGRYHELYSTDQAWDDGIPVTKYFNNFSFNESDLRKGDIIRLTIDCHWVYFIIEDRSLVIYGTPRLQFPEDWVNNFLNGLGVPYDTLECNLMDKVESVESALSTMIPEEVAEELIQDHDFRRVFEMSSGYAFRAVRFYPGGPGYSNCIEFIGVTSYGNSYLARLVDATKMWFQSRGIKVVIHGLGSSSEYDEYAYNRYARLPDGIYRIQ